MIAGDAAGESGGPRILLGISGGIAAYKAAELVRRLRAGGATVRVVMTAAAQAFITPLTLQAVSGSPVRTALLDATAEAGMDHIELARWAEQVLVAPATAHLIARLAHGLADDLLTTLLLATAAPVTLAPAMNQQMWLHPATAANIALLQARGVQLVGPEAGEQACGEVGPGRMAEPATIAAALLAGVAPAGQPALDQSARPLQGRRVLLTAGATHEALDPVRFIGNRSSGKMGYAVASALAGLGAQVTIVSGPASAPPPPDLSLLRVESALEMHRAVMQRVAACDLFVAVAAVADYRPADPAAVKLKKGAAELELRLVRNPDILGEVAALPRAPFTVGFAAETDDLERHAAAKLAAKRMQMIAANLVGPAAAGAGFSADDNALLVLWRGGRQALPRLPKADLANVLAGLIAARYQVFIDGNDDAGAS